MKIFYKHVALLAVLSIAAAGCQKENIVETQTAMQIQQNVIVRDVTYTIDGVTFYATIRGEQNWHDFIGRLLAIAKEGHKVSFRNNNACSNNPSTKETIHFDTTDPDDANKWCNMMSHYGYTVSMVYDERTGTYHCTATKPNVTNPQTDTTDTGGAK